MSSALVGVYCWNLVLLKPFRDWKSEQLLGIDLPPAGNTKEVISASLCLLFSAHHNPGLTGT